MPAAQTNNPLRWLLWSVSIVIGLLLYLNAQPLQLTEVEKQTEAERPPRRSGGEVLLVIDPEQVRRSAKRNAESTLPPPSFEEVDWSYAWLNTLEQEFGPYTLIERGSLRNTDLTPYRFVILTHSVAGQDADEDLLGHLRSYGNSGGVLVFERPTGRLRAEFAADGTGGERPAKAISHVTGLDDPYAQTFQSMPLFTPCIGSSGPAQGAVTYMAMDGVPVIYRTPVGRGFAVTLDFNYGLQLMSLQQGRPQPDFTVRSRNGTHERIQTTDLIAHPMLANNPVPYADLLESYLVHVVLADSYPVISMWPFQGGRLGALLMTHDITSGANPDEYHMGDDALWMAHWEKERKARSTWFATAEGLSSSGARTLARSGNSVQLSWIRHQAGQSLSDPVGLWLIQPLRRVRSLEEQRSDLQKKLPKKYTITANRNHMGLWSERYTDAFQLMAAAEIAIDTSYAPPPSGRGYSFGTGLPFRVMDTNGLPLPVLEHPLITSETNGKIDLRYMHTLMRDSQEMYHQAMMVRFDPDAYTTNPDPELFDLWQTTYDMAENRQHAITTVTAFYKFWHQRINADIRSRLRFDSTSGKTAKPKPDNRPAPSTPSEIGEEFNELTAEDPTYKPTAKSQIILDIEAKAPEEGHYVTFPAEVRGRRFIRAIHGERTGEGSDITESLRTITTKVLGRRIKLGRLRKGYNSITVTYR